MNIKAVVAVGAAIITLASVYLVPNIEVETKVDPDDVPPKKGEGGGQTKIFTKVDDEYFDKFTAYMNPQYLQKLIDHAGIDADVEIYEGDNLMYEMAPDDEEYWPPIFRFYIDYWFDLTTREDWFVHVSYEYDYLNKQVSMHLVTFYDQYEDDDHINSDIMWENVCPYEVGDFANEVEYLKDFHQGLKDSMMEEGGFHWTGQEDTVYKRKLEELYF